jgi:hypothetical protein
VSAEGGGCVAGLALRSTESAASVTLSVVATKTSSAACVNTGVVETVQTHLASPLGERTLIDAATGRPIDVLKVSSLADVRWLPPGFDTEPSLTPSSAPPGVVRAYQGTGSRAGQYISISQYPGAVLAEVAHSSGLATQSVDVNGSPGLFIEEDYGSQPIVQRVAWAANGNTYVVESRVQIVSAAVRTAGKSTLLTICDGLSANAASTPSR